MPIASAKSLQDYRKMDLKPKDLQPGLKQNCWQMYLNSEVREQKTAFKQWEEVSNGRHFPPGAELFQWIHDKCFTALVAPLCCDITALNQTSSAG